MNKLIQSKMKEIKESIHTSVSPSVLDKLHLALGEVSIARYLRTLVEADLSGESMGIVIARLRHTIKEKNEIIADQRRAAMAIQSAAKNMANIRKD